MMQVREISTTPDAETEVDEDGYVLRDGEVIGRVDDRGDPFVVDTPEKADWVLEKMATAEGNLLALAHRRAAVLAQFDRLEVRAAVPARLAAPPLRRRAGPARPLAADGQGEDGPLHLRLGLVPAVEGDEQGHPHGPGRRVGQCQGFAYAVDVKESITASAVVAAIEELKANGLDLCDPGEFLESSGPRESVTIDTGVGKGA